MTQRLQHLPESARADTPSFGSRHSFRARTDPVVQLGLLGSFSLLINKEPVQLPMSSQRLVCFLALRGGMLLRRHIAGSLWGETSEIHAAGSLRSVLSNLGHVPVVETVESHIQLFPSVEVDLRTSEAFAHRILDPSHGMNEAELDESLLSAELLPDWTEDWVLVQRESHNQLRLRALEAMCRRLCDLQCFGHAVQVAMLAVSGSPLRESAQRTLVAAHLAEGNNAAAVRQYNAFRELLQDEVHLEPSAEMLTLIDRLTS
jgi:DNA-binding SARP family transcriptional activator